MPHNGEIRKVGRERKGNREEDRERERNQACVAERQKDRQLDALFSRSLVSAVLSITVLFFSFLVVRSDTGKL